MEDAVGDFAVVPWHGGHGRSIVVPPYRHCRVGNLPIVATFHTHPNTGPGFLQEPSDTDKRFVRDDPDLKGSSYIGELVISEETIYLVDPTGGVHEVVATARLLA